jgi:hypothetical protein
VVDPEYALLFAEKATFAEKRAAVSVQLVKSMVTFPVALAPAAIVPTLTGNGLTTGDVQGAPAV